MSGPDSRRRRVAFAVVLVAIVLVVGAAASHNRSKPSGPSTESSRPSAALVRQLLGDRIPPLVVTYFFYWYDAATSQHLRPQDGLPLHLPASPAPSWKSVSWFESQLTDMADADIDVALPVYWGSSPQNEWSSAGLGPLVAARDELVAQRQQVPSIGMFYDTSILRGMDLTTEAGIDAFYANIRTFFKAIPEKDWATVENRPLIWLFLPQSNTFDQRVFDVTYARFSRDFGLRPFIIRATGWDCATTVPNCGEPIRTDASYVWGVAQDGMQQTPLVASAGPGYDERQIPGRPGTFVPRDGGRYYRRNLSAALRSGRPIVSVETWNEIHEASAICDTVEYGRTYIDLTRSLVDASRRGGT